MNARNDEQHAKMNNDSPIGCNNLKVYSLDAVPSGVERHLHRCPVESCGHELVMVLSNKGNVDRGSRSYRWALDENGMPVQELLRVRMPNSCWCGAPLPGSEAKSFDLSEVRANRLLSEDFSSPDGCISSNLEQVEILQDLQGPLSEFSDAVSQEVVS